MYPDKDKIETRLKFVILEIEAMTKQKDEIEYRLQNLAREHKILTELQQLDKKV
jgi:hypothetical protein